MPATINDMVWEGGGGDPWPGVCPREAVKDSLLCTPLLSDGKNSLRRGVVPSSLVNLVMSFPLAVAVNP